MINEFGYIESFNGINGNKWRGVVEPNPPEYFLPSSWHSWIFAKTKKELENKMRNDVKRILRDCLIALDSLD